MLEESRNNIIMTSVKTSVETETETYEVSPIISEHRRFILICERMPMDRLQLIQRFKKWSMLKCYTVGMSIFNTLNIFTICKNV